MSRSKHSKSNLGGVFRLGSNRKARRIAIAAAFLIAVVAWVVNNPLSYETVVTPTDSAATENSELSGTNTTTPTNPDGTPATTTSDGTPLATAVLEKLEVKGRAPKTGYDREEFYKTWPTVDGCSLRQRIIKREFGDSAVLDECDVISGEFTDPYTGEHKVFNNKSEISKGVQIDHVVALSDAWQKGAQYLPQETRYAMATDPLNLLAVDASANQQKSDGDAATWLPKNKAFRCAYVARQVSVKYKYGLWVTDAEKSAISDILSTCPAEPAIGVSL